MATLHLLDFRHLRKKLARTALLLMLLFSRTRDDFPKKYTHRKKPKNREKKISPDIVALPRYWQESWD